MSFIYEQMGSITTDNDGPKSDQLISEWRACEPNFPRIDQWEARNITKSPKSYQRFGVMGPALCWHERRARGDFEDLLGPIF
jgi:hypothetical protein